MIIGVDHGNAQIQTARCCFPAGLEEYSVMPPLASDGIEMDGRIWTLVGKRIPYMRDKTQNESYFILTLFAICKELEARQEYETRLSIDLAAGLPPEHYGSLRSTFSDYLNRKEPIRCRYNGREIELCLQNVFLYPQAYAAASLRIAELREFSRIFLVDIGGYTTDILLLRSGKPDLEYCRSLNMGIITMTNHIAGKVNARFDLTLDEEHVSEVLSGKSSLSKDAQSMIRQETGRFAVGLLNKLRELQVDIRANRAYFVGGGSILLRPYLEQSPLVGSSAVYFDDPKANAIGYEKLAEAQLHRMARNGGVEGENR